MRVIRKGRDKNWKREMECKGCGALLEVMRSDCKFYDDQRDGAFYSFTCPDPECREYNTVAAKLVDR